MPPRRWTRHPTRRLLVTQSRQNGRQRAPGHPGLVDDGGRDHHRGWRRHRAGCWAHDPDVEDIAATATPTTTTTLATTTTSSSTLTPGGRSLKAGTTTTSTIFQTTTTTPSGRQRRHFSSSSSTSTSTTSTTSPTTTTSTTRPPLDITLFINPPSTKSTSWGALALNGPPPPSGAGVDLNVPTSTPVTVNVSGPENGKVWSAATPSGSHQLRPGAHRRFQVFRCDSSGRAGLRTR